ncbi:hypothetical protein GGR50DRAFT_691965 [Xylaria sp. CBS 124048]|nr:hypothetical protein GGR50DRAFT_691965 [Xylaria sp. CBS 124048]
MAPDASAHWSSDSNEDEGEINISMVVKPQGATRIPDGPSMPSGQGYADVLAAVSDDEPAELSAGLRNSSPDSSCSDFGNLDLQFGEVAQTISRFVPFALVRQYPALYVDEADQQLVADYFNETLLKGHYTWNFFAQYYTNVVARDPLILVPTRQFEVYLDRANHTLNIELGIPEGTAGDLFTITFGDWSTPRPRFIGHADSIRAFDNLRPYAKYLPLDQLDHLIPEKLKLYGVKMDRIYEAITSKRRRAKNVAAEQKRLARRKNCSRTIKRAQRYLGLRKDGLNSQTDVLATEEWDVSKPALFQAREHYRIVCIDCEAWEMNPHRITEIGLAILDTGDIVDIPPGEKGENWWTRIRTHHLRIEEYKHIVNKKYLQGCPDSFNFGQSEMVSQKHVKDTVRSLILGNDESGNQKPIIMVGHDLGNDLKFLTKVGFDPWATEHIIDEIDTMAMFNRIERCLESRNLGLVCAMMDIIGSNYHNAGNDAAYTLYAMIAMAIKRTVACSWDEGLEVEENGLTAKEEDWTDGEMDDGGDPKRSTPPVPKTIAL